MGLATVVRPIKFWVRSVGTGLQLSVERRYENTESGCNYGSNEI
jgi:hypothetical protein